jgi:hypothetical protein
MSHNTTTQNTLTSECDYSGNLSTHTLPSTRISLLIPDENDLCFDDNAFINNTRESRSFEPNDLYTFNKLNKQMKIHTIAIDIDQTIGDFGKASVLYKLYKHFNQCELLYDNIKWYFEGGVFRPYLSNLMQYLHGLRMKSKIDKIVIITSIHNTNGYVDWICKCIEEYSGIKNLFDEIRDRTHNSEVTSDGSTYKNLNYGEILIDDKPYNVTPCDQVIGISQYYCNVDASKYIELFNNNDKKIVSNILDNDAKYDSNVHHDHACQDRELDNILLGLHKILGS